MISPGFSIAQYVLWRLFIGWSAEGQRKVWLIEPGRLYQSIVTPRQIRSATRISHVDSVLCPSRKVNKGNQIRNCSAYQGYSEALYLRKRLSKTYKLWNKKLKSELNLPLSSFSMTFSETKLHNMFRPSGSYHVLSTINEIWKKHPNLIYIFSVQYSHAEKNYWRVTCLYLTLPYLRSKQSERQTSKRSPVEWLIRCTHSPQANQILEEGKGGNS